MAISQKAIIEEIHKHKGNITRVAESFGVTRGAIHKRVNNNHTIKKALDEARDQRKQTVEDTLYKMAVDDENVTAAIFIAKTQLGWKETSVHEHSGEVIKITLKHDNTD